ncbi:MAG: TetR/AcrR family transcriptional regulator [Nocardioides sp.]
MSESAVKHREAKRYATSQAISLAARQLADQHGLDGFTMDDLAAAAGVSRRTLFNYFPGKLDALLGEEHHPPEELVAEFLAGGPSGVLLDDLLTLVLSLLKTKPLTPDDFMCMHRLVRSEPRIVVGAHERMVRNLALFADFMAEREGPAFDPRSARLLGRMIMAVFDESMETFAADPTGPQIADLVDDGLRRMATMFA